MSVDLDKLTISGLHDHLKARVAGALEALGLEPGAVPVELAAPPNPEMGDYGFACFPLAKLLRKAPPLIAKELADKLEPDAVIAEVGTAGPYLNLRLDPQALIQVVIGQVLREGDGFGGGQANPKERWMVEYSAPNTNKPLHLGHVRNNLLGASVHAIIKHYGHDVTRVNLVNDRGVHICKSMLAYKKWGEGTTPEAAGKKGDHLVGDFYVLFDKHFAQELEAAGFEGDKDEYFNTQSALGAEVRKMLLDWEAEQPEVRALWQKMNSWVLAGFDETYARMGVGFDRVQYESQTYKLGKELVQQGLDKGVLSRRDDGAVICDLSQVGLKDKTKVLLRSDGTSVYMTQDLGTAMERFDEHEVERLIYVVGDEQNYHFDVLFRVLGLLRDGLTERCYHLGYGMIRLPEGKMKSREGKVVDADDLMDEVAALAREETEQRATEGKAHTEGISDEELSHRAERIGMAALKYFLLKFSPKKSFVYDPKESIDFLGQTGPYCLFNYARTRSLLRRAGGEPAFDPQVVRRLGSDHELEIVRLLAAFPEVVARAVKGLDPSRVAEYCFELCKSFAFVFTDKANHPIVTCDDAELRQARLMMAAAVGQALRTALGLLGIEVLEEM